jgi:8-oxo-dGTP diphosphatase
VTHHGERHHRRSGDGFVTAADGLPRWGRFGAAGVLVRHVAEGDGGEAWYVVARRSEHTHRGGTWAIPGGALDEGEAPLEAALREFAEELGMALGDHEHAVAHVHEDDHGGWSYWTVVIDVVERFPLPEPPACNWETADVRWVTASELAALELFDAFRATLVRLGVLGS